MEKATRKDFVPLRRGTIEEHLRDGRLSAWEFCALIVIIIEADFNTGCWRGDGKKLASLMHCSWRQASRLILTLELKKYLKRIAMPRRGSYFISVTDYAQIARPGDQDVLHGPSSPPMRHDHATLLQETKNNIQQAPQKARRPFPREVRDAEAKAFARAGTGPEARGETMKNSVAEKYWKRNARAVA